MLIPIMADSDYSNWTEYFARVQGFLDTCERQYGICNSAFCEYAIERLSTIADVLDNMQSIVDEAETLELRSFLESLVQFNQLIRQIMNLFREYSTNLDETVSYATPSQHNSQPGRPSFSIQKEQLEFLRSLSFTWVCISRMLMVSRMTIYRRRVQYGMIGDDASRTISDSDLQQLVQHTTANHPFVGQSFIWGVIRSRGFKVTRERVRQMFRRCDPLGSALRWGSTLSPRQPYSVPGPNCLWHIGMCFLIKKICCVCVIA